MKQVVIENPIINSPFEEPKQHFRFDADDNITNEIVAARRPSSYFVPIASPKKKGKQSLFDESKIEEKKTESDHVNRIRGRVKLWRDLGWPDITPVTRSLLEY